MIDLEKVKQYIPDEITPQQEIKIKAAIYPTIEVVCEYLNDYFYTFDPQSCKSYYGLPQRFSRLIKNVHAYGNYIFSGNKIFPISGIFQKGDLIRVIGTRNKFLSYVEDASGNLLALDRQTTPTEENALIMLMCLPECVEKAICEIIIYDIFTRETPDNLKSESIGSYSYTKNDVKVGTLYYPPEIVSGIEIFKKMRFV